MKFALINPNWSFEGSIYFGCREAHLPLEFGYAKAALEDHGHEAWIIDAQLEDLSLEELVKRVESLRPDFSVVTTAPSYLFWRCAPPELRVPIQVMRAITPAGGRRIVVGPHASTTPETTLRKLNADAVVMGECEHVLPQLAGPWNEATSICHWMGGVPWRQGGLAAADMNLLKPLRWPQELVGRHHHHHHRFEAPPTGRGAEVESSRGCPYACTFCAKDNFRDRYRRRPVPYVLEEIDGLIAQGVEYVYFIDEIFLPNRELLEGLAKRTIRIGVQTRLDLWSPEMIDALGKAGCVSIEAGVESVTPEGRDELAKRCKMTTDQLADRLIYARGRVPFVQANLIEMEADDPESVAAFRARLSEHGVWANEPVPLFPYPGSPDYTKRWGTPDDKAWERAHEYYLDLFSDFSDIQEQHPAPLPELEFTAAYER